MQWINEQFIAAVSYQESVLQRITPSCLIGEDIFVDCRSKRADSISDYQVQ